MVNGNYVLYGDRSCSESEIVDDHVQTRTAERKVKRKTNRTANELQHSLNLAKLDNETDSVKYEKKIKEPRLLRYIPTSEVRECYITEKYESYDQKATEELPRRHNYTKKPKNPSDGSFHYSNSRSSSSCSSPNGNLPTISEQCEQYGTYRIRPVPAPIGNSYENKLDKYFAKPRDVKAFSAKGSHPDSLYRVATDSSIGRSKTARVLRVLRWPIALLTICVALGVFVYFLVPSNLNTGLDTLNATNWEDTIAGAQSHSALDKRGNRPVEVKDKETKPSGTKTPEIDFYDAETERNYDITTIFDAITEKTFKRKLPAPPVFPSHITPEIQYGNEKADLEKLRSPKVLEETRNTVPSESTLKPQITLKPEKPLAIYFQDGSAMPSSTESMTINDGFANAETSNGLTGFVEGGSDKNVDEALNSHRFNYREPSENIYSMRTSNEPSTSELPPVVQEFYSRPKDMKFTSGHSKMFGISVEEAEHMKSTTQHSLYNTRVSPTLPTWRDRDEATTKKYPDGLNNFDVPQCRSTSIPLCRGILPYDLAGPPVTVGRVEVTSLLPQIEYLIQTNCSERAIHFACALLEPECSPQNVPKLPCYNFCKGIVDSCDGSIPAELSPLFHCNQYSSNNCASPRSPCLTRELACGDGSCIPRDWVCDGTRDCPLGEDEEPCSTCDHDEYRCSTGMCITKRWLCDGYSDCPSGEDEKEELCRGRRPQARSFIDLGEGEPGEESAGSAPAPSIRKPNRIPNNRERNTGYTQTGESDSSKELLMTSDSTNGFRRNFTRRPSPSRLSLYTRPKPKATSPEVNENTTPILMIEEATRNSANKRTLNPKSKPVLKPAESKIESVEDINLEDLGLGDDEKDKIEEETKKPTVININSNGQAATASGKKMERFIDSTVMMRTEREDKKDSLESAEMNVTLVEKSEEMYNSAHASPCPSGELRCVDGRCIALAQLCDGTIDCSDHADEDNCYT